MVWKKRDKLPGGNLVSDLITQIHSALADNKRLDPPPQTEIKIYYGCGTTRQPGYVNVDVRKTEATDVTAELGILSTCLRGCCREVYMSHVLEHFGSPGKKMRTGDDDVLGALLMARKMLTEMGTLRVAVPDFRVLCELYLHKNVPLYPRLLGRISGEQEYPENLHRCVFDRDFLTLCLSHCGLVEITEWDPVQEGFNKDSSFDRINGVSASLNLKAVKKKTGLDQIPKDHKKSRIGGISTWSRCQQ